MNDFDNRQIFCVKGCNDASNFYFQWIKQEVSSPAAPALVPDSLTATTLSLEWFVPSKFAELAKGNLFKKTKNETYFVQCHEDSEDDWKICGNQSIYENSTIHMERLQPYTKYKVRRLESTEKPEKLIKVHFSFASPCCCQKTKQFTPNRVSWSVQMKTVFRSRHRQSSESEQSIKHASWCRGSQGWRTTVRYYRTVCRYAISPRAATTQWRCNKSFFTSSISLSLTFWRYFS